MRAAPAIYLPLVLASYCLALPVRQADPGRGIEARDGRKDVSGPAWPLLTKLARVRIK